MKTVDDIIDDICKAEGEGTPPYIVAGDRGGRTTWGISERSHPAAWRDGPPSLDVCKAIYRDEYVLPWAWVNYEPLRVQLIDFSVTSGQKRAAYWLQRVMGLEADGIVGEQTRHAVNYAHHCKHKVPDYGIVEGIDVGLSVMVGSLINNALVAARLKFIDELTDEEKSQKKFEEGWENRALSFLVLS